MFYLLIWWVLLLLISFAGLPVTLRFLRFLPDRGYAFAKPLALLLWAGVFWLLADLGFIQNTFGALAFLLVAVAGLSWGLLRGKGDDSVIAWLRANLRYVLIVEGLFTIALLGFAFFRAYNPEITATEKPMEFMFLNSILRSPTFPPQDAWLSGYGISYYYLGYVIVAALAKLGNIPSSYAFNLGLIMTFAMAAVGAFGLIFNVVTNAQKSQANAKPSASYAPYIFGILAVFLLLIIGNFEGVFEAGYNNGNFSQPFIASLDLHGLEQVQPSGSLAPDDNWWWWRASRVLNDKSPVGGGNVEVIDEFPAFSFLLGDLHPHVLALPFDILALAIALNLLLSPMAALTTVQDAVKEFANLRMLLTAFLIGAFGMLNTWDFVTYGVIVAAAFAISQYRAAGKFSRWMIGSSLSFLVLLFVGGYLLFLPFYVGFSSQAHGIAPNIFSRTPLHSYLIMFGMFVFVLASFIILLFVQSSRSPGKEASGGNQKSDHSLLWEIAEWGVLLLFIPVLIAAGGLILLNVNASLRDQIAGLLQSDGQNIGQALLTTYATSFVHSPGVFLLLVVLIASLIALGRKALERQANENSERNPLTTSVTFIILIGLVGFILTFGTEFLYIRDSFETRMNTVFKLYYQSWLLLSMATTFGAFYIWQTTRGSGRAIWLTAFGALFALSMVYPVLAYPNRANGFRTSAQAGIPSLDGWHWVENSFPDDYSAIQWAGQNIAPNSVILEAPGNEYSFDDRVSVATGFPTVLGWGGHELQWRGNYEEAGPRENDVKQIYQSHDLKQTRDLLDKYSVDYVFVGDSERQKYNLNDSQINKFGKLGEQVFQQGSMHVFRVSQVIVSLNDP